MPYSNDIGKSYARDGYNFSLELGIGYNLINKENFILYAQPTIEKMMFSIHKNIDPYVSPLMIGVVIGTKF